LLIILATEEAEKGGSWFKANLEKKMGMVLSACHLNIAQEA
jgi:hypothetical protein